MGSTVACRAPLTESDPTDVLAAPLLDALPRVIGGKSRLDGAGRLHRCVLPGRSLARVAHGSVLDDHLRHGPTSKPDMFQQSLENRNTLMDSPYVQVQSENHRTR